MKTRVVLILTALAVLVAIVSAAFLLTSSPFWSRDLTLEKQQGLPKGTTILAKARSGDLGPHKGDAFPYIVEVWYDPAQVSGIDRDALDKGVDLKPFEIRGIKEKEFTLDARTRVYQREYEIQLIVGEVGHLYEFPTMVIRYGLVGSGGLANTTVSPEPVFVAPRLPAEVPDVEFGYGPLRPIAREVEGASPLLPTILWVLGGGLAILGAVDLARRAIPQWTQATKQRRQVEGVDLICAAYRTLSENVATAAEPKRVLHQTDHVLRMVLAQKEKTGWLEELNPDMVSPEIREAVVSLLEKCQKAYSPEVAAPGEGEDALRLLEEILGFYFGQAELEAWRT